jgi:uncharacterized membrane protein YhaH (DUF805 family)
MRFFSYDGRAPISEFWRAQIGVVLTLIAVKALMKATGPTLGLGLLLIIMYGSTGVTVRRLHDTDKSGWWAALSFVPLLGLIWWFMLGFSAGTRGPNRYGPPER